MLFHEWMYENRFFFVDKLITWCARGAATRTTHHPGTELAPRREGPYHQPGHPRGMSLLLAALCAEGTWTIRNVAQIDRGYENVEGVARAGRQDRAQFRRLGATHTQQRAHPGSAPIAKPAERVSLPLPQPPVARHGDHLGFARVSSLPFSTGRPGPSDTSSPPTD